MLVECGASSFQWLKFFYDMQTWRSAQFSWASCLLHLYWSVNFCMWWGLNRRSSATGAVCWMCHLEPYLLWSVLMPVWHVWCLACRVFRVVCRCWLLAWSTVILFWCQLIFTSNNLSATKCLEQRGGCYTSQLLSLLLALSKCLQR